VNADPNTSTFGKYQLIASLGRGGMANVYLALAAGPAGFNKLLVIKSMREDIVDNVDGGMEMFLDEARLTARMVHPNIVSTYEVGKDAGLYFLAMEYLEGQTYRAVCNRGRPDKLPIADELRILAETARGLHYAHDLDDYDGTPLSVVHRDVSPQNIFVTYDGLVKLLDFGIAKTAEAEHVTQVGVIKGKIDYIAPEQLRGDAIDRRADVFALGAMLWETLTRKRFAGGRNLSEVVKVQNRLTGGERKVRDIQPGVPEALAQIVDRAIALKAAQRFETAAAFADAIDNYLASASLKPSARTLSAVVMPLFEGERQRMRKTIEEQIQRSKTRGSVRPGYQMPLPSVRASDFDSPSGMWVAPDGGSKITDRWPSMTPQPVPTVSSVIAPASAQPKAKPGRNTTLAIAISTVAAFAGGTLALTTYRRADTVVAAPPAPAAVAPTPTPSLPPTPARSEPGIRLHLTVLPETARVTLDGAPLSTPFSGEFRADRMLHQLVVRAEGYRPLKQLIAFDRDSTLQVTLDHVPPPSPPPSRRSRAESNPPPPSTAPVAEPVAAPAVAPTPPVEPRASRFGANVRTIDLDDPYSTR
jgi:serine/threonine protein kinase